MSFQTLAQRKLAALQQKQRVFQQVQRDDPEEEEEEKIAATTELAAGERTRKRTKHTHPPPASTTIASNEEDEPEITSDASVAEAAALAAFLPSGFGARPKEAVDTSKVHAARARKPNTGAGGAAKVENEVKVKIEGQAEAAPAPAAPAAASTTTVKPKKAAISIPAAPASLFGGAYDSDEDDDDDVQMTAGGVKKEAAASSASSTAAASSSAAAAVVYTDSEDEMSDTDEERSTSNPLLRILPISHEVSMSSNGHTAGKSVTALACDKSGGRLISGSTDYTIRMWDFGGMNEAMTSYKSFEPLEGHQVKQLTFSPTGDMFLCVTGGAQPKLYSRDAVELSEFVRGDMYIIDQKQTKGHSTPVTSGWFHPTDRHTLITSGIDATIRIWDVNDTSKNLSVIKLRGVNRGTSITTTAFSHDGKIIAAAANDGSIHLVKHVKGRDDYRDSSVLAAAHTKGIDTSSLLFARDDVTLYSRGGPTDDTLKQWDIRAFRQPVHVVEGLPNAYNETDIALSPDERVIVTGTSAREQGDTSTGQLVFLERSTMKPLQEVAMNCSGVIRVVWHREMNQIITGCNDGIIRLLYDPTLSQKGALMCLGRKQKAKPPSDYTQNMGEIITPHSLPAFRSSGPAASGGTGTGGNRKRAREKQANALVPEKPVSGKVGVAGRPAGSQSMAAYQLSKYVSMREDPRAKDPREALLAMDDLAKKDPIYFNSYAKTQPVTIFQQDEEEDGTVKLTQEEIDLANKKEGETH